LKEQGEVKRSQECSPEKDTRSDSAKIQPIGGLYSALGGEV